MRKTIQIILCIFAVVSLIVTGIAFYQIVLASSIHGAPVRFVNATAGPYAIKVAFYNDPINAGDAIPFNIAVAPRLQRGIQVIRQLMDEGYIRSYEPEFVIEMLINFVRWLVSMYFSLKEEEVEPFKQFSVQWLANALLLPHS